MAPPRNAYPSAIAPLVSSVTSLMHIFQVLFDFVLIRAEGLREERRGGAFSPRRTTMQDASRYEVTTPPVPERVVKLDDRESSLEGVIDSTARGPAAGGCRIWTYPDRASAHREALRLAAGMSYKNALAELPLGRARRL